MYPMLEISIPKLKHNTNEIINRCSKKNISVAGVIKGCNALNEVIETFIDCNIPMIASSRIEQLKKVKSINCDIHTMVIRIPMLSEIEEVVRYCNSSLNSEKIVIEKINNEAKKQNKTHNIIIMADLGDLREGYINYTELVETALYVESLDNCFLYGIGVNLGCYGSIKPTVTNLNKLVEIAEIIENKIDRKLDIISGGSTSSLALVLNDNMPNRINHLRIGEGIFLKYTFPDSENVSTSFLHDDVFILKAEIIEKKDKPSYPIGDIFLDAFGNTHNYEDIGIRTRIILGVGNQDIGNFDKIIPLNDDVKIIGASSDHLICDITSISNQFNVGDILKFKLRYQAMLFSTESLNVKKKCIK